MARVNIDILGISELKWTRMGKFNSDDCCIYYCGQESLRRNRVALIVKKTVQSAILGCNLKNDSSDGKESACNAGDQGLIPGLGLSFGEGNSTPLQYSCHENPMNSMKRQ